MTEHQPTRDQLDRLKAAWLSHAQATAETAQARAALSLTLAHEAEAATQLSRVLTDVLYGPQGDAAAPVGRLYDLSSEGARAAWPTDPPAPGG